MGENVPMGNARRHAPSARAPRFSPAQLEARRAALPPIRYPEELPVSARRQDIARAIAENQVVIISGETGSGKTTQLPKICLELGRGITGMIGHTQPRRIAARSVAERIAEELAVPLGGAVGYQVRFTDQVSENTLVKLMTDGILLAEIQGDPLLSRYDTIIVDEAHERSLNIDFLLGYLAGLLARRPDLKLIITSATIDSARFAAHFGPFVAGGGTEPAPVIEVSGRTYPVEIRYRSLVPDGAAAAEDEQAGSSRPGRDASAEPIDQFTGICLAADELMAEGPGDILVFLSGEREIRDAESALIDHLAERYVPVGARGPRPNSVEILPLYARLSAAEQHRVFESHIPRRIVLATNVAETSLTVPGIRYVIDPGTARISRYSTKTKVQRLPIEPISQASANQRSGRCGRVAEGIAIRLYSAADMSSRPEFTEPEILRTSLAAVILQMAALGLGDVARFPFVDPPDLKAVRDGIAQLTEIGALEAAGGRVTGTPHLTKIGRQLARLPIDPRLGRMLIEADKNGCAAEVLVIVAALSVQDVRERPAEKQEQADQLHRRFTDPTSDFLAYLNLWRYLRVRQRDLSSSAFRRLMRGEYLNFLRFREWQDVVSQLRQLARPLGLHLSPLSLPHEADFPPEANAAEIAGVVVAYGGSAATAGADEIHRALLVGLLGNLGTWDEKRRDYEGARGTHFTVWPGSGLVRKRYDWVMAAELVETSRLFARTVARVDQRWIEPAAGHLVKKQHSEAFWSTRNGAAMVHEKVTLYGLTVVADRTILLGSLGTEAAAADARMLFIRHALVGGEWNSHHKFVALNRGLLEEATELENRTRQRGLVADDEALFKFYDERIPATVISARHFDSWWKQARQSQPDLLDFSLDLLLPGTEIDGDAFPTTWQQGDLKLPISYNFDPTARDDGLTVHIPISVLPRVTEAGFDWLVPGMRAELAVATIKALPKRTRVELVPAPDSAKAIVGLLGGGPLDDDGAAAGAGGASAGGGGSDEGRTTETWAAAFARAARELRGVVIPPEEFDSEALPKHLRANFVVEAPNGKVLASSKSLVALQHKLAEESRAAVRSVVRGALKAAAAESPAGGLGRAGEAGQPPRSGSGSGAPAGSAAPSSPIELAQVADFPTEIPATVSTTGPGGFEVRGYPALVAETKGIALRVLPSALEQARAHRRGVIALALSKVALSTERITSRWPGPAALTLGLSPYASTAELVRDVQWHAAAALGAQWETGNRPLDSVRTVAEFAALVGYVRERLEDEVYRVIGLLVNVLDAWRVTERTIRESSSLTLLDTITEVKAQLAALVYPGFVAETPPERLKDLARYLQAARLRVERAAANPRADATAAWQVRDLAELWETATEAQARMAADPARDAVLGEVRWLIEELRVSLFAQQLGTSGKVSAVRIRRLIES